VLSDHPLMVCVFVAPASWVSWGSKMVSCIQLLPGQDLVSSFAINDFSDTQEQDGERVAEWFWQQLAEAKKRH
jgi:hypothetical protein